MSNLTDSDEQLNNTERELVGSGIGESNDEDMPIMPESTPIMLDIATPSSAGFNPTDKIDVDVPPMLALDSVPDPLAEEDDTLEQAESSEAIGAPPDPELFTEGDIPTYQLVPNWILEIIQKES
jgi:hypothetical protein